MIGLDKLGEEAAIATARREGCAVVARNYRGARCEVDLVLRDGEAIVFAEVKTRTSDACGSPAEAVTHAKARRYTRAALAFLQDRRLSLDTACRFDVFAVAVEDGEPRVEWIKNAFEAVE
jgi:putative endonuclease